MRPGTAGLREIPIVVGVACAEEDDDDDDDPVTQAMPTNGPGDLQASQNMLCRKKNHLKILCVPKIVLLSLRSVAF